MVYILVPLQNFYRNFERNHITQIVKQSHKHSTNQLRRKYIIERKISGFQRISRVWHCTGVEIHTFIKVLRKRTCSVWVGFLLDRWKCSTAVRVLRWEVGRKKLCYIWNCERHVSMNYLWISVMSCRWEVLERLKSHFGMKFKWIINLIWFRRLFYLIW